MRTFLFRANDNPQYKKEKEEYIWDRTGQDGTGRDRTGQEKGLDKVDARVC